MARSDDFVPTVAGVHRWTVRYEGDARNEPVTTPCRPSNAVTITGSTPPPSTTTTSTTTTRAPPPTPGGLLDAVVGLGGWLLRALGLGVAGVAAAGGSPSK